MIELILYFIGFLAAVIVGGYLYLTWNFDYWKKRGIDGPKPVPLFGNFPSVLLFQRNLIYDIDDVYKKYKGKGKFVGVFITRNPQLLVVDPETARDVLVRNFKCFNDNERGRWFELDAIFSRHLFFLTGDSWKHKRNEITPAFTVPRIKAMYPIMKTVCSKMIQYIEENNSKNKATGFEAKELAAKYTTENVSNCVYGIDVGAFSDSECLLREKTNSMFVGFVSIVKYHYITTVFPILKKVYKRPLIPKDIEDFYIDLMKNAIEARKSKSENRVDYLNYIMQLQEKKDLTDMEMVGHAMTFFIDGLETSATVIAHFLHMIARYPEIQDRLRKEILDSVNEDGEVSFENLNDLPYLDQCVNETLRMFPPGIQLNKLCTEPCDLTNSKDKVVHVEKDTVFIIPVYSIHNDEEYYKNPKEFNPDRFSPEFGGVKKYKDMGVFIPFGDGPRQCLGMRFAYAQIKVAIVEILRNCKINLNPKTKKEIVMEPTNILIMQQGGVWIDFEKI